MKCSFFKMMKKGLPWPFTFILEANNSIRKTFKNKKKTVGIRVPDNNITRLLVQELGHPIVLTSLHHEDEILEYPTDPELIHESEDGTKGVAYGNTVGYLIEAIKLLKAEIEELKIINKGIEK